METRFTPEQLEAIRQEARYELARRDFWSFCKLMAGDFYKEDRPYLKRICTELQEFYFSDEKVMVINEPPRHGKKLANDTPVLTTRGWKNHGDLAVGDYVFAPNGAAIRVEDVLPKSTDYDYEVEFANGEKVIAHANHEWVVYDRYAKKMKTVETNYMIGKLDIGGSEHKRGHRYRFQLPLVEPIVGEHKELPVHPYFLGAWLGDGNNVDTGVCACDSDIAVLEKCETLYPVMRKVKHKTTGVNYWFYDNRVDMRKTGMCYSGGRIEKHIPEEYLTADIEQRLELLAGLLDTDGSLRVKEHRYIFTTADEQLKDDFVTLVGTFGWRSCVREVQPTVSTSGIVGKKVYWQIGFNPTMFIPCQLERKQLKEFSKRRKITITSITKLHYPTEGNCITVEGGVYLVGKTLVPTHNSRTAQLFTQWVFGRNPHEKVLTASYNEQLSTTFARAVRDAISEKKASKDRAVYSDIFPSTRLKRGSSAANMWTLEGAHVSYLATSPSGTVTGFGGSCFPEGTMVATPDGEVDIAHIADKNIHRVLTFNHESGKLNIENITVFRRKWSNELIEITTSSGRKIKSTCDHRYYTEERGYVRADELKVGNRLKTLPRDLYRLWETENGSRTALLGMSQKGNKFRSNAGMQSLWKEVYRSTVCGDQASETWSNGNILFESVFVSSTSRDATQKQMPCVRGTRSTQKVLFGQLQTNSVGTKTKRETHSLSNMRERVLSTISPNGVLFERMFEQSPLTENDGNQQLPLQNWNELSQRVSGCEADCDRTGQSPMSNVWCKRGDSSEGKMGTQHKSESTSQRRESEEQRFEQSDYSMREVSHFTTQDETIVSIRLMSEPCFVYDVQVEKNHNFFANGVLVHNCLIIDDIVKNAEEAYNETILEKHWTWFTNTMLSRLERGGKVIIIATRWHSDDLAGRALRHYESIGVPVRLLLERAIQPDGTMLCDGVLDRASYDLIVKTMGKDIVEANYNQRPVDISGKLYQGFKTYSNLPVDENGNSLVEEIHCYCDTADKGDDYLCAIIYGVYKKQAYVLDVYFTKDGMEITEPELAKRLYEHRVQKAFIESNNGGRGFARSVERILREKHHYPRCFIDMFYQSKNKKARILSSATWVQENVIFPVGWEVNYEAFYNDVYKYQKEGKAVHDDAEDCLAGIADKLGRGSLYSFD